ncbi:thiol-disulfide oxidoreductase DCC family protein [Rufibacter immobilis]|uniref:Thiol-disulfide oxidoreductase DCC family protein n=1 Tax=Rufibacter immobilis TaxID=1348778 RepID=A0A3M9MYQ5_9BACT|nr:thiol-disulfide oxidoreductase DCC family protein [Rufibacter immobilis]RNI30267.1 thiol-disulfide oxidoreductase DCC family protein [Rufibacter immobilis]
MLPTSPTILFDGVCNLCNGFVQFVIRHDTQAYFRFASLQSGVGQEVLSAYGMPTEEFRSFLFIEDGQLYSRSTAALKVFRRLGGAWGLLYGFMLVPKFLRDPVYDWVSRNRYRWFGQQESCMLPIPALKARFL